MTKISQQELEALLNQEAEFLDTWNLDGWLDMFTDDCAYLIPTTDLPEDASPLNTLFYIADNHYRLAQRVERLKKKTAYAESPRSRMRRTISNVSLMGEQDGDTLARCNFIASRCRYGITFTYVGQIRYRLRRVNGQLRIREKRVMLDQDGLTPQGRITAPL